MNESHQDHYSQKAAKREEEVREIILVCRQNVLPAEEFMVKRLAHERRKVWTRAANTLQHYVGERPVYPAQNQMEHHEDYQSRIHNYECALSRYLSAVAFVEIIRERMALEEPPVDATVIHV